MRLLPSPDDGPVYGTALDRYRPRLKRVQSSYGFAMT
jgi:hypothetical protein